MSANQANEFDALADECLRHAETMDNADDAALWRSLALQYLRLAADLRNQQDKRCRPER